MSGIASNWGTNWQELARQNSLSNPNMIYTGQVINFTGGQPGYITRDYTVRSGDRLRSGGGLLKQKNIHYDDIL